MSLTKLASLLQDHVGYNIELTLSQDHDPDLHFRMSEGLEGIRGRFEWTGPSIYVSRLEVELRTSFPDRSYEVKLRGEVLHVGRVVDGKVQPRFRLESPILGKWILSEIGGQSDPCDSFMEAVTILIEMEI